MQSFQKVYNKAEELIMEYNEELSVEKSDETEERESVRTAPKARYWKIAPLSAGRQAATRNGQLRKIYG